MAELSKIEWTDHTFNPWIGCSKVSKGCENCYAETLMDKRYGRVNWGPGNPRSRTSKANWRKPIKWDQEAMEEGGYHRVFCASLADWLDAEVPIRWLSDLLDLIRKTPHLEWLLLSKRLELWKERLEAALLEIEKRKGRNDLWSFVSSWLQGGSPVNVWVGTSVEDQKTADERIPQLLEIPATIRFVSYEPALEAVDFQGEEGEWLVPHPLSNGDYYEPKHAKRTVRCSVCEGQEVIDWIIVGGESGPNARPFDVQWARDTIRQCREAGIACFVKQLGRYPEDQGDCLSGTKTAGGQRALPDITDPKGGDWNEWPEDLRVREFPELSC